MTPHGAYVPNIHMPQTTSRQWLLGFSLYCNATYSAPSDCIAFELVDFLIDLRLYMYHRIPLQWKILSKNSCSSFTSFTLTANITHYVSPTAILEDLRNASSDAYPLPRAMWRQPSHPSPECTWQDFTDQHHGAGISEGHPTP